MLRTWLVSAVIIVTLSLAVLADEAVQTDWSGGGGVPGPVTGWGDEFDSSAGISWLSIPGQLALSSSALASPVPHLIDSSYAGPTGVDVGDIDGDGDIDIVGTASTSGVMVWWENDGGNPPSFTEYVIGTPPGAAGVDLADVNSDGRLDVVAALDAPRRKIVWKENLGGDPIVWGSQVIESSWQDAWEIETGDVNGDGHLDVICISWTDLEVAWWENDGGNPIVWTKHLVGTIGGAHSVRCADIDADGDMDLAVAAGVANKIVVYWSDGADSITWTRQDVQSGFTGARSVRIADIDQDGDLDLAGICWSSDVMWWRNDGGDPVVWTAQTISTWADGGHCVYVADMNGDGRPDVMGACVNNDKMAWWENGGGDPITWTQRVLSSSCEGAITVRAADLNQDGDLEAVGACFNGGEFLWWEATEFGSAGDLTSSIMDAGPGAGLAEIDWTSVEPTGTGLRFQVRSSDDSGDLGSWSGDITSPGSLGGTLGRYMQYKVLMETSDPDASPVLQDVTFLSAQSGVDGNGADVLVSHLSVEPNPINPDVRVCFELKTAERVRLDVFDVTGRMVIRLADRQFPAGDHQIAWDGTDESGRPLSSGVYWLCLETAGRLETREVVLLR